MGQIHSSQHSAARANHQNRQFCIFSVGKSPTRKLPSPRRRGVSILSAQRIFAQDLGPRYGCGERVQDFLYIAIGAPQSAEREYAGTRFGERNQSGPCLVPRFRWSVSIGAKSRRRTSSTAERTESPTIKALANAVYWPKAPTRSGACCLGCKRKRSDQHQFAFQVDGYIRCIRVDSGICSPRSPRPAVPPSSKTSEAPASRCQTCSCTKALSA